MTFVTGSKKRCKNLYENCANYALKLNISFQVLPSIEKVYIFWKETSQGVQK